MRVNEEESFLTEAERYLIFYRHSAYILYLAGAYPFIYGNYFMVRVMEH